MSKKVYAAYAEQPESVEVCGSFAVTSDGDDPTDVKGVGFTATKTGTGDYLISFDNVYNDLICFTGQMQISAVTTDNDFKMGDYTAGSGSTGATVQVYTRLVDGDGVWAASNSTEDANARLHFRATFKRVSDI